MTPLNTIIEEEKKRAREKLLAVTSSGDVWNTDDFANELLTTAMQRAYEAGQSGERAKIRESFDEWNKSTEDIHDWADRMLSLDKTPNQ